MYINELIIKVLAGQLEIFSYWQKKPCCWALVWTNSKTWLNLLEKLITDEDGCVCAVTNWLHLISAALVGTQYILSFRDQFFAFFVHVSALLLYTAAGVGKGV